MLVKLSIVVQSHLSDALIELDVNPNLARQRIAFIKTILFNYTNLKEEVETAELDAWYKRLHPDLELAITDEEIDRQVQDLIEEDWDERDSQV